MNTQPLHRAAPREPDPSQHGLQPGQCLCLRCLCLELGGGKHVRVPRQLLVVGEKESHPQKAAEKTLLPAALEASQEPSKV